MRFLTLFSVLLASSSAAFAADMTHEEIMVRTAYAKFAYAVQQGAIGRLAIEADNPAGVPNLEPSLASTQRLADAQVKFVLSDFVIGDVRNIVNQKAIDLITPADGVKLDTSGDSGTSYSQENLNTGWQSIALHWKEAPALPALAQTLTVAELYEANWHEQWPQALFQRYASYSVTVTYQGKTVGPYKALFLFGRDAKGNEVIVPQDATVNAASLGLTFTMRLFPDAFVLTRLRNLPVVASWLKANQVSDASCSVGKGDVCCDVAELKCGPGQADVAEGLAKPFPAREAQGGQQ